MICCYFVFYYAGKLCYLPHVHDDSHKTKKAALQTSLFCCFCCYSESAGGLRPIFQYLPLCPSYYIYKYMNSANSALLEER